MATCDRRDGPAVTYARNKKNLNVLVVHSQHHNRKRSSSLSIHHRTIKKMCERNLFRRRAVAGWGRRVLVAVAGRGRGSLMAVALCRLSIGGYVGLAVAIEVGLRGRR